MLRPTTADIITAAAKLHSEGKFQMAGDVVKFPTATQRFESRPASMEEIRKADTRATLSRALGGTQNVLPIKPEGE